MKSPDLKSERTRQRATALAYLRGCEILNSCWWDCYDAAFATITECGMSEWERQNIGRVLADIYGSKSE